MKLQMTETKKHFFCVLNSSEIFVAKIFKAKNLDFGFKITFQLLEIFPTQ